MSGYKPFAAFVGEVLARTGERQDQVVIQKPFVERIKKAGDTWVIDVRDAPRFISPKVFSQLVTDRLGGSMSFFKDTHLSDELRRRYLNELAEAAADRPLVLRITGDKVDAVLSEQYAFYDNNRLLLTLAKFTQDGTLPSDLYVHSSYVSDGARELSMRLISPDNWNHGSNGGTYYGSVAFANNEVGTGSLVVAPAIARVACFNYVLASNTIQANHRFTTADELDAAIRSGVQHIQTYSATMYERMQHMKGVAFDAPEAVFAMVGKQLGLPEHVENKAKSYWLNEGSDPTAYGLLQAITNGTQEYMVAKTKKSPVRWDTRNDIEQRVWMWSESILDRHQKGEDVNRILSDQELIRKSKVLEALTVGGDTAHARQLVVAIEPESWVN